jgi:hypothetical protein
MRSLLSPATRVILIRRRRRIAWMVVSLAVTTGACTTVPKGTSATSTQSVATSSTTVVVSTLPRVYSVGCPGEHPATTRPSELLLSCADGNAYVSGITWSSWTSAAAQGSGMLSQNNCTPDCAGGSFVKYPTSVTLGSPMQTKTQGLVFATVTWTIPQGSPMSEDLMPRGCTSDPSYGYC